MIWRTRLDRFHPLQSRVSAQSISVDQLRFQSLPGAGQSVPCPESKSWASPLRPQQVLSRQRIVPAEVTKRMEESLRLLLLILFHHLHERLQQAVHSQGYFISAETAG